MRSLVVSVLAYKTWSHKNCLLCEKDNPVFSVAAGSGLYLHTLSTPEGGAVCLSVIKLFT